MARNLYAGTCYSCGSYVPPGYGHFERTKGLNTKWRVKCVKCASGRTVTADDPCVKAVERRLAKMDGGAADGSDA
jgi:hypothetical protein